MWFNKKKYTNYRGFRVFVFALYPKLKTRKSWKVLLYLIFWYYFWQKWPKGKKLYLYDVVWEKKCPFPRFPSFRFCPIFEIENLESLESFPLLQVFIVSSTISMGKISLNFKLVSLMSLCHTSNKWRHRV